VSHGSVYRHFPSKAALRDAVAARWLARISGPLGRIADDDAPSPARLRRWFDALLLAKRRKVSGDPELFATYSRLVADSRDVVRGHVVELVGQVTRIVADGVARGEMTTDDPEAAARAVFDATARFHNPAHAAEWSEPGADAAFEGVWALVMKGLGAADTGPARKPKRR
jgi:AcrR family transcriptional regulator